MEQAGVSLECIDGLLQSRCDFAGHFPLKKCELILTKMCVNAYLSGCLFGQVLAIAICRIGAMWLQ